MKIGLLCPTDLNDFNIKVLEPILSDNRFKIKMALIDHRQKPSAKTKFIKNFKRGRGGYMLIMLFNKYFSKKEKSYSTIDYCMNNSIDYIDTDKPYSDSVIGQIKTYELDALVMLGGFGIVKEPLLSITPIGIISYHHGNMRKYRGQPVAFWELYNNENEMGVTVQKLSKGIDTGTPIHEITIPISSKDTVSSLRHRAMENSVNMMHIALCKLLDNNFTPEIIQKFGKNYTIPNLRQFIILRLKLFHRHIKQRKYL